MMAHSAISVQPAMMVTTSNAMLNQWSSGVCDCCEDMGVCKCGVERERGKAGNIDYSLCLFDVLFSFMKGSIQDDCCVVTFCTLCVWCQMARELKARRHSLVIINPAVNPVHQSVQVFNQPLQPINPAY
ncbi:hypothetical protein cypCar_00038348 [Cyprinus carpio]|nr:hypothetical protein cypCar_00038348 [Cyprinus carpio]